jgi:hypothetical protein
LRPGGLALVQIRNFDRILANRERWMPPQSRRDGEREWLFLRFYDLCGDDRLTFNIVTLYREGRQAWQQQVRSTTLYAIQQADLMSALIETGFAQIACWGNMDGSEYVADGSTNLIVTAHRI